MHSKSNTIGSIDKHLELGAVALSARMDGHSDISADIELFANDVGMARCSQKISKTCRRQLPGQSLTEQER
jgi:hypothetical protein